MPDIIRINENTLTNMLFQPTLNSRHLGFNLYMGPCWKELIAGNVEYSGELRWSNPANIKEGWIKLLDANDAKWENTQKYDSVAWLEKIFEWVRHGWTITDNQNNLYIVKINTY